MILPYLSFVIWTRNDEYAPDMLLRQQMSLLVLIEQLERYELESEIIIVEWNPPADRPLLKDVLQLQYPGRAVTVRIITVGEQYHRGYKYADIRPIHCHVAANVGIRRARAQFVLPKATDTFYSGPLVKFLSSRLLSTDDVYRCDRYDFDAEVLQRTYSATEMFLESCGQEVIQRQGLNANCPGVPPLRWGTVGDFLLMSAARWHAIRGFWETHDVIGWDCDTLALNAAHGTGASQILLPEDCKVFKPAHRLTSNLRVRSNYTGFTNSLSVLARLVIPPRIRCLIRYALNFPKRTIEFVDGEIFDSFERIVLPLARKWAKGVGPFYLNDENWGLGEAEFRETVVRRGDWEN